MGLRDWLEHHVFGVPDIKVDAPKEARDRLSKVEQRRYEARIRIAHRLDGVIRDYEDMDDLLAGRR